MFQATAEGSRGDRIISRCLRPLRYFFIVFDVFFDAVSSDFVAVVFLFLLVASRMPASNAFVSICNSAPTQFRALERLYSASSRSCL